MSDERKLPNSFKNGAPNQEPSPASLCNFTGRYTSQLNIYAAANNAETYPTRIKFDVFKVRLTHYVFYQD